MKRISVLQYSAIFVYAHALGDSMYSSFEVFLHVLGARTSVLFQVAAHCPHPLPPSFLQTCCYTLYKKICWLQIGHKKTYIFKDEHVVFLPKHDSSKILKIYDSQIQAELIIHLIHADIKMYPIQLPSNHKKKTNKQGCVPIVAANLQSHGFVGIKPQLTSDTKSNSPCVSQKNTSLLGMKTSSLLEIA